MRQRGKKSAAAMTAVPVDLAQKRPAPPSSLNAEQAVVWQRVTNCFPASWFRPADHPLLEAYCRHTVQAARIDRQIDKFEDDWLRDDDGLRRYSALLDQRRKETAQLTSLARSMRITHQSREHKSTAARAVERAAATSGRKPWDDE